MSVGLKRADTPVACQAVVAAEHKKTLLLTDSNRNEARASGTMHCCITSCLTIYLNTYRPYKRSRGDYWHKIKGRKSRIDSKLGCKEIVAETVSSIYRCVFSGNIYRRDDLQLQ